MQGEIGSSDVKKNVNINGYLILVICFIVQWFYKSFDHDHKCIQFAIIL